MSRPEASSGADIFYNAKEARKYHSSSRMMGVQREITERAIELLRLNDERPALVLDVGCGSGLSGQVLEERGHVWVGCDISRDMLTVAKERMIMEREQSPQDDNDNDDMQDDDENDNEQESNSSDNDDANGPSSSSSALDAGGDLLHHDMGTGLPFRPATFDACISISALQWLCYSNASNQNPRVRLTRFFSSLYSVLKRGGRAVLQFYPETAEQAVLISETATRVGFAGGVVVDYPNSAKAKKHYLVLSFDKSSTQKRKAAGQSPALDTAASNPQHVSVAQINNKRPKKVVVRKKKGVKTKEWILHKKESQRKKGKAVRPDTKFTARRRPHKF